MKKLRILILGAMLVPGLAFAHGSKAHMTGMALEAALEKFETEETGKANDFLGAKGWISGDKMFVKVYLPNDQVIQYTCHEMEEGDNMTVMCEK